MFAISRLRRASSVGAGLALMVSLGVGTPAAAAIPTTDTSPASAASDLSHRRLTLVGKWYAEGSDGVNTIANDVFFYRDHTLAIIFPGRPYQGRGHWYQDRHGAFSFYQQHPDLDDDGNVVGHTRAEIIGRQTGPESIYGVGPVRSYDLNGELILELQVTFDGERLSRNPR